MRPRPGGLPCIVGDQRDRVECRDDARRVPRLRRADGRGLGVLEDAIATSRAAIGEAEAARGYRMLGTSASVLVEYARAERWLREGIEYAERVELWNDRHYMAAHLAHVLWATGRWDEAAELARQALADGRGGITTRNTALHVLGYVACRAAT